MKTKRKVESRKGIRRRVSTFSTERHIREFHVVVIKSRQRNAQKSVLYVQSFFLPINPMLLFLTFPLPSWSSVLKLPMTKKSEPTNVNCICKIQSTLF